MTQYEKILQSILWMGILTIGFFDCEIVIYIFTRFAVDNGLMKADVMLSIVSSMPTVIYLSEMTELLTGISPRKYFQRISERLLKLVEGPFNSTKLAQSF